MDTSRIQQAKTLFDRALDVPAEKREGFLREICPDDPDLVSEVMALLNSEAAEGHFMSEAVKAPASLLEGRQAAATYRIGPYRVERLLGRGGMGEVWQGIRDDGAFRKAVAIKIMTTPLEGEGQFLERFRQERQVLANLDHPGIARILDGGELSDGRPYMVMDYIEGLPLDRHCHERQLSIQERIRLMMQVCEAVEYLHSMGVIHRDLKPGNILVTSSGTAKLLDFGIARVNTIGQDVVMTAPQHRLLTPGYASPEQMAGETCTPRSDIYSLGAVLYVLLTQQTPSLSAPTAPSGMLTTVAGGTSKTGPRLPRHFLGDLDGIAMKALERNPAHRYQTALEFAADLQRFLEGVPVKARSAPWPERAARFVRRRRGSVVAAAAVALLMAFGAVQTYRSWRAQISSEAVSRQFAMLAAQIPKAAIGEGMTAPEIDSLIGEVRKLRLGLEGMAQEPPPATAAAREKRGMVVREIAGFLDRTVPVAMKAPPLANEVARTFQAAAEVRAPEGGSSRAEAVEWYSKAGYLLKAAQAGGHEEPGLGGRINAVEKRIADLGGDVASLQSALIQKWGPLSQVSAEPATVQEPAPVQAQAPPPASPEKRTPAAPPASAQVKESAAVAAPAGWQDRLAGVSGKATAAAQALEQKRQELQAGGLSLSPDLLVSSQQMQSCLESARAHASAGQWEQAQDYLTRADGYANRLLRALGR